MITDNEIKQGMDEIYEEWHEWAEATAQLENPDDDIDMEEYAAFFLGQAQLIHEATARDCDEYML